MKVEANYMQTNPRISVNSQANYILLANITNSLANIAHSLTHSLANSLGTVYSLRVWASSLSKESTGTMGVGPEARGPPLVILANSLADITQ